MATLIYINVSTSLFLFPFDFILLKLFGKLLFLLFFHITMQMFGGIAESGRHQDLSVLTQLISDPDQELLQLHSIFKDLRICPAGSIMCKKSLGFLLIQMNLCNIKDIGDRRLICIR